jgi:large subunit ribosomal protein L22
MAAVETPQQQTVRAQAKFVRASARKARLVTDLIRGRSVPEARTILAFSDRAISRDIERVLRSAVANAESRPDLLWNGDDLVVQTAYADEGATIKRHRARARGRVGRIMKRTCHITIVLVQSPAAVAAAAAAAPATRGGRRRRAEAEPQESTLPTAEAADTATTDAGDDTTTHDAPSPEPQAPDESEEK